MKYEILLLPSIIFLGVFHVFLELRTLFLFVFFFVKKHNKEIMDEQDKVRNTWITGSLCQIYSHSQNKWFQGVITKIFADDEGEWLEVKQIYN